jgi:hypothetical protein
MTEYCDFDNSWTFNNNGDLTLTTDYFQSVSNRFNCPRDYLSIYYGLKYGSDLKDLLGDNYNEEHCRLVINKTLNDDQNITTYTINEITYTKGVFTAYLTIDGVEIILDISEMEEIE